MTQKQNKKLFEVWLILHSIYLNKEIKNIDFAKYLGFEHYRDMMSDISNSRGEQGIYSFAKDLSRTKDNGSITAKFFCLIYEENFTSENVSNILSISDNTSGNLLDEHVRVIYEIHTHKKLDEICCKEERLIISNKHKITLFKTYIDIMSPDKLILLIDDSFPMYQINDNDFSLFWKMIKFNLDENIKLSNNKYKDAFPLIMREAIDREMISYEGYIEYYNESNLCDYIMNKRVPPYLWLYKNDKSKEGLIKEACFYYTNMILLTTSEFPNPSLNPVTEQVEKYDAYGDCYYEEVEVESNILSGKDLLSGAYNEYCPSFHDFISSGSKNKTPFLIHHLFANLFIGTLSLEIIYATIFILKEEGTYKNNEQLISNLIDFLSNSCIDEVAIKSDFILMAYISKCHTESIKESNYKKLIGISAQNGKFDILINELRYYLNIDRGELKFSESFFISGIHDEWIMNLTEEEFQSLEKRFKTVLRIYIVTGNLIRIQSFSKECILSFDREMILRTGFSMMLSGDKIAYLSRALNAKLFKSITGNNDIGMLEYYAEAKLVDIDLSSFGAVEEGDFIQFKNEFNLMQNLEDSQEHYNYMIDPVGEITDSAISIMLFLDLSIDDLTNNIFMNKNGIILKKENSLIMMGKFQNADIINAIENNEYDHVIIHPSFNKGMIRRNFNNDEKFGPNELKKISFSNPSEIKAITKMTKYGESIKESGIYLSDNNFLFREKILKEIPEFSLIDGFKPDNFNFEYL